MSEYDFTGGNPNQEKDIMEEQRNTGESYRERLAFGLGLVLLLYLGTVAGAFAVLSWNSHITEWITAGLLGFGFLLVSATLLARVSWRASMELALPFWTTLFSIEGLLLESYLYKITEDAFVTLPVRLITVLLLLSTIILLPLALW